MASPGTAGSLSHIRVLDLAAGPGQMCSRIFADLGADVIKVEPPGGDPRRWAGPFFPGEGGAEQSIEFVYLNRGKRSAVLDLGTEGGRERVRSLAATVDVLVEDGTPGDLSRLGLGYEELRDVNPALVFVSVTPFGQSGPRSGHPGGDLVAQAAGGIMFANGDDQQRPAMVPYHLITQIACLHGAFGALVALRARRSSGEGQHVDVSMQEVVLYCQGAYIPRYSMKNEIAQRERLANVAGVDTYRCADGSYVNVAPFMPHHFTRLARDVMHHPVLSDPEWSRRELRQQHRAEIRDYIAEYLASADRDAFVEEGQAAGVPVIPVLSPEEFVRHPHTAARGFFRKVEQPGVGEYMTAGPPAILGVTPWRVDRPAPAIGEHSDEVWAELEREVEVRPSPAAGERGPPLAGLRIVDFTRAFAGPLTTMFLGFFGAEVIKIESADLEDNRNPGEPNYPELHRTKLSCTIDTRKDEGKALIMRMLAGSGVVVENFRPGVMERLGLSYEELRSERADAIMLAMPGFGNSGPLRDYYSYGQQVMGMTGLTHLWGHPQSPLDARTKYAFPDYVAGITGSLAVLAALEHRDRTGEGQYIELSQVEALAHLLSAAYIEDTELGRPAEARGNFGATVAPHDIYPCAGDDAWCAIEVHSEEQWEAMLRAMSGPKWAGDARFESLEGRVGHKADLDRSIGEWTSTKTPHQVARILQGAGVPASIVATAEDLYYDWHLHARNMVVAVEHAEVGRVEHAGVNVHLSATPGDAARPTPARGEHNDYVFSQVLALDRAERERLEAAEVLR